MKVERLITVSQLAESCPALGSEAVIRWLIFNAEQNGLNSALVRVGRRVYFDQDKLEEWLDKKREVSS